MSETKFRPVRGIQSKIDSAPIIDGYAYFATDTGKIYLDVKGKRIAMGGSGAALLYGNASKDLEPDEYGYYLLNFDNLEEGIQPKVGDLIINSDGSFYRIIEIDESLQTMTCIRIAVSGTGGGGGGTGVAKGISLRMGSLATHTLINGQNMSINFTATSATDADEQVLDDTLVVVWTLQENGVTYSTGNVTVDSGVPYEFEFGTKLRENATSTLLLQASGINSGSTKVYSIENLKTVELTLQQHTNFNSNTIYSSTVPMYCIVSGAVNKVLEYFIDDDLIHSVELGTAVGTQSYTATGLAHGHHLIKIQVTQLLDNGDRGVTIDPIEFEIAVNTFSETGDTAPIIWLGDYNDIYYSYDSIKIPFTVYNPIASNTVIRFFKGVSELSSSPRTVANSVSQILEITDAEVGMTNSYYIRVNDSDVYREVSFEVQEDTVRTNYKIQYPENLILNFDAAGRSNDESEVNRQLWTYTPENGTETYQGKFTNFNWYNNGWMLDEDNNTCLRISNGAQFSVPIGAIDMNTTTVGKQSTTFEFQFKVRNVQDYSNLIKEITRYANDGIYWDAFLAQTEYENYDQFLQWYCAENGLDYDKVTENFSSVYKQINLTATFCQYYNAANKIGLCLGPQDGFFATGDNTVSVKYVEDEMTNLTVVFNYTDKRIYIYLNGVLSGVSNISSSGKVTIDTDQIVFNSEYCDLDLYKFRVYNTALDVVATDINYSVDRKNVTIYDHTSQLALYNTNIGEYQFNYDAMLAFNNENPTEYLMPYLIIETAAGDMLPYSKANKKTVSMEFVNTGLDRAYQTGELDALAAAAGYVDDISSGLSAVQQYYMYHCPSWKGSNINLAVQGTSSEFYPRRNYKAKTKDGNDNINMYMHKGPFATAYAEDPNSTQLDFFYMNNETVGTTKFTLKIDYMESSGTYNMGFANLVKTAYTKHPINDYNSAGAFTKSASEYLLSTDPFSPDETYYQDSQGKVEVELTEDTYQTGSYYVENTVYNSYTFDKVDDYRTSVQGYPVLTFWKDSNGNMTFIGRYNMLIDKGSDECYGFKPNKKISQKFKKNKAVRKIAECWEYSNNNRGFCSFRDPQNRKELDFLLYDDNGKLILNSKSSCPVVSDSFEYRYHTDSDLLDYLYDPTSVSTADYEALVADYGEEYGDLTDTTVRANIIKDKYSNWETAVKWVWSTCTDVVPSLGTYEVIEIAEALYETGKYFIYEDGQYKISNDDFSSDLTYYTSLEGDSIKLTDNPDFVYENSKYYTLQGSNYVLDTSGEYDPSTTYYQLIVDEGVVADDLEIPVIYNGITYTKDTKEYRLAKFKNELTKHFSLEYCLVYFVMTEVFLCYDSRGKNCMMASWGPQEDGGEYIWYPLFYDIDTQLGINNTGIPSYEYSVNATLDDCFSTSDSVLWNNLFTCFFDNIKSTYHTLKNNVQNINTGTAVTGPIYSVDHIEKWYLADPEECGNQINMRGARPLIALNMDEFYKYISICNPKVQYQGRSGEMLTDNGTYFYALQGNRSLSRQQFLARRINFIDSWLSEGDYSRSTGTDIHGRISANYFDSQNSDKWIEGSASNGNDKLITNTSYYVKDEQGNIELDERGYPKKTYYLDADTYVDLTPYQKSYVTLGDDNEAFDSLPYENKPVKFDFPTTLANGMKTSGNYSEQLLYLYGASSLKDIGDISKLYWAEFYAVNAPHISRLLLGNDHPDFFNKRLKMPNFDAGIENKGKPLLKEVNLTNVTIDNGDSSINFDFSSSEKMEIFKAVGSNINSIKFADGVALHTLHLPETMSSLKLVEANNLTSILTTKPVSTYNGATDVWTAPKGLYITGITDDTETNETSIASITLAGGALGYDSYKLLHKLYELRGNKNADLRISVTNVMWSPYKKLEEGYQYDGNEANTYYVDDGHYGFTPYTNYSKPAWETAILNGEIYKLDTTVEDDTINLIDLAMFRDFYEKSNFMNTDDYNNAIPTVTGDVYFNNTEEIDEGFIRNTLLEYFPNLNVHFASVKKAYSARFISMEDSGLYALIGTQKISQDNIATKIWFDNPYNLYEAERNNYDFHGWSTTNSDVGLIESANWSSKGVEIYNPSVFDYTFYAIFTLHEYEVNFYIGKEKLDSASYTCPYGSYLTTPSIIPSYSDSSLELEERYRFLGWTQNQNALVVTSEKDAKLVNIDSLLSVQNYNFYAVFIKESVYAKADTDLLQFIAHSYESDLDSSYNISSGYRVAPAAGKQLSGKITIPVTYTDPKTKITLPVIALSGFGSSTNGEGMGITHVFWQDVSQCKCRQLYYAGGAGTFQNCASLEYFQFPEGLRQIAQDSFRRCTSLVLNPVEFGNAKLYSIGQYAFNAGIKPGSLSTLKINGSVEQINTFAFGNIMSSTSTIETLTFGGPNEPSQLNFLDADAFRQNGRLLNIIYYYGDNQASLAALIDTITISSGGSKTPVSAYGG